MCNLGFEVSTSELNVFWATDLMHRALHIPLVSEGVVGHYAEDYAGVLQLAKDEPTKSALDSDALQYFAIEAWAYDIAAPGVGCPGPVPETTPTPTPTSSEAPVTQTSSAAENCHTHSDGVVHCE